MNVQYMGRCGGRGGDDIHERIAPGQTWTATSRGICTVIGILVELTLPNRRLPLTCAPYEDGFFCTSYSQFSIIMKGDDACCVQSSHESGVCL